MAVGKQFMKASPAKEFRVVTFNVMGSVEEGKMLAARLDGIVDAIWSAGAPDLVCLQEASDPVKAAVLNRLEGKTRRASVFDKENLLRSDSDRLKARDFGRIIIMSLFPLSHKQVISTGSYVDDGVLSATVRIPGGSFRIYNVHLAGGSFGVEPSVGEIRRTLRIQQLEMIRRSIERDSCSQCLVCGDFNFDANDSNSVEVGYSLEKTITDFEDVWEILCPGQLGATEDEEINTFRSALKRKPQGERRRARYDRILSRHFLPLDVSLIGREPLADEVEVVGRTALGRTMKTSTHLFPSDHFGVSALVRFR